MKLSNAILTLAFVIAGFAGQAHATTPSVTPLLLIDDTNPADITFMATSYNPFLFRSDSTHTFNDGIDLLNFFAPNTLGTEDFAIGGTLTTSIDGTPYYNDSHSDMITGDNQDFNIYTDNYDNNSPTEDFSTSFPAFAGTATLDLSGDDLAPFLLPVGTIGSIFAGYSGNVSSTGGDTEALALDDVSPDSFILFLGTYEIVPEPSTWALVLSGLGALAFFARRRQLNA